MNPTKDAQIKRGLNVGLKKDAIHENKSCLSEKAPDRPC